MIRRIILALVAAALFSLTTSAAPITYISSGGKDTNPCSRSAPCRTFSGGLQKTDVNGDLIVLDSGIYGRFDVGKSVRITAVGVYAGTGRPFDTNAATVSVGPSDVVVLRGLTITGNHHHNALEYNNGGTLHVEGCVITQGEIGLLFRAAGRLFVKDSFITANSHIGIQVGMYNCYFTGVPIICGAGTQIASIDHCQFGGQPFGLVVATSEEAEAIARVTVRDSLIGGGVYGTGPNTQVNVYDCQEN